MLPSGTVTFLLTDLEGSTRMWEQEPEAMKAAMVRHDELLEKAIAANHGFVFSRMGDGMAAAFSTAGDAVAAAVTIKQALARRKLAHRTSSLKARIGLHTAEAVIVDDSGYANLADQPLRPVDGGCPRRPDRRLRRHRVAVRISLPDGVELSDLGEHRLRDLGQPMQVFELSPSGPTRGLPAAAKPGRLPREPARSGHVLHRQKSGRGCGHRRIE